MVVHVVIDRQSTSITYTIDKVHHVVKEYQQGDAVKVGSACVSAHYGSLRQTGGDQKKSMRNSVTETGAMRNLICLQYSQFNTKC